MRFSLTGPVRPKSCYSHWLQRHFSKRWRRRQRQPVNVETVDSRVETLESRVLLATQLVELAGPAIVGSGTDFDVTVNYQTLDDAGQPSNQLTDGAGFRIHYDNTQLTPNPGASTIFSTDNSFNGITFPFAEGALNDDGNPNTNTVLLFTWASFSTEPEFGQGVAQPITLARINFTAAPAFTGIADVTLVPQPGDFDQDFDVAATGTPLSLQVELDPFVPSTIEITTTDADAAEAGADPGTLTITRTNSEEPDFLDEDLTVDYAVTGSATNGSDFQVLSGSVVIPSGSATAAITILPLDDPLAEGNETVTLTLTPNQTSYTIGSNASAAVTIADDDPVPTLVNVDTTLVLQATNVDSNGEVDALPVNEEWIDEWNEFDIELWVTVPNAEHFGVADSAVDLTFDPQLFTATQVAFGPGFSANQSSNINNSTGRISSISASTTDGEVGDGRSALFARVHFESSGTNTVPLNTTGQHAQPVTDLGLGVENISVAATSIGTIATQTGPLPETELRPVVYDLNDRDGIDFGDFSVFAGVFRNSVEVGSPSEAFAADFNFDNQIDFGDFSLFAANFRQTRESGGPRIYSGNFPTNDGPTANSDSFSISEDDPFTVLNNVITGGGAVSGAVVDSDSEGNSLTVTMADGGGPVGSTLTFTFNYEDVDTNTDVGFDDPALGAARRTALEQAAAAFGGYFDHTANVEIDVTSFNSPGISNLASGGSRFVSSGGTDFREVVRNKVLSDGATDENGADADGTLRVNFGANFELSANPLDIDNTENDFFSTMAHELAHAFGFASTIDTDGTGIFGDNQRYGTFDQLITDSAGTPVIDGGVFNQSLWDTESVGGFSPAGGLFFSGTNAVAANGGNLVGLFTPTTYDDGSSVSHIDDENPLSRGLLQLAASNKGPGARTLSPLEAAIFQDLGYSVFTTGSVGGVFNQDGLEISLAADGELAVFPNDRFSSLDDGDSQVVTFDYEINNGNGETDTASVSITINGANDAPVTRPDALTVIESGSATFIAPGVLSNDLDVDSGDSLVVSEARVGGSDLFFSEYVEGTSGNSVALGIFNPTESVVFGSDYEIRIYADGSATPTTTIPLASGNVGVFSNQEYVVASTGASFGVAFSLSRFDDDLAFDGNDTIELFNIDTNTSLDVIGIIGTDPGSKFSDGGNTTQDTILFRNANIVDGNPNGFTPLSNLGNEWTADTTISNIDFRNHTAGVLTLDAATNIGGALITVNTDGGLTFNTNGAFDGLSAGQTQVVSIVYTASDGTASTNGAVTVTVIGTDAASSVAASFSADPLGNTPVAIEFSDAPKSIAAPSIAWPALDEDQVDTTLPSWDSYRIDSAFAAMLNPADQIWNEFEN